MCIKLAGIGAAQVPLVPTGADGGAPEGTTARSCPALCTRSTISCAVSLAAGLSEMGTLGLLNDSLQRKWLSEEECLRRVEKMRRAGFAIRRPHANESFLDYIKTFPGLN